MKKIISLFLATVLIISLAACAFADDLPFKGRTVSIAFDSSDLNDAYQAEFDLFSEKTGATVEVELLSSNSQEATNGLVLRAANGNLPDIFQLSLGSQEDLFDPANNLFELEGYEFMDNVVDAFKDAARNNLEGKLYAVPARAANVAGIFFNKNVIAELGIDLPETWAEFLEVCEWIRDNTDMDAVFQPCSNSAGKQIPFLAQNAYVLHEDPDFSARYTAKEINLSDNAAMVRAMTKMEDLAKMGVQNLDPLSGTMDDAALALCEGTAAFVICRTNIMSSVEIVAPEQYNDLGFIPYPDEDADYRAVTMWMPTGWHMAKNAKDPEVALALLEFLTTPEAIEAYCNTSIPVGSFMVKGVDLPDNCADAVKEAQMWSEKAGVPNIDYTCAIVGQNRPTIFSTIITGDVSAEEGMKQLEADYQLYAEQKGIW